MNELGCQHYPVRIFLAQQDAIEILKVGEQFVIRPKIETIAACAMTGDHFQPKGKWRVGKMRAGGQREVVTYGGRKQERHIAVALGSGLWARVHYIVGS